jgi:hypothetical protein
MFCSTIFTVPRHSNMTMKHSPTVARLVRESPKPGIALIAMSMRAEPANCRAVVLVLTLVAGWSAIATETQFGVAHIGGGYSFSEGDYLNEGAAFAESVGCRCIKVALALDTEKPSSSLYAPHSQWPPVDSLAKLADTPHFRDLFTRDFDTFILVAFRAGRPAAYWRTGLSRADEVEEEACFAELTRHLLTAHAGTRKVFVIQNWEGDWAVRGSFNPKTAPADLAVTAMIRWLAARQRGIERGRRGADPNGPRVLHACEVNLVAEAMKQSTPSVTTDVLPHVGLDLVSYSAWDTKDDLAGFEDALAFIASHQLPSADGGGGVYIGEFGFAETGTTPGMVLARTRERLEAARRFGCPYAVYWQVFCNEPVARGGHRPEDYRGFWLVRPDGSRSPVCDLFAR